MRYPWLFLFLAMALLIGMSLPAREMNAIGAGGPQGVGEEAESRKGFELLSHAFPIGEVAPISLIVQVRTSPTARSTRTTARGSGSSPRIWRRTDGSRGSSRSRT